MLNAPVFTLADGTPEPRLKGVYDGQDRLVRGEADAADGGPVQRVQKALKCVGLGDLLGSKQADGIYGDKTNDALHEFKRTHDLQPAFFDDVGPKTMHCLNSLAAECEKKGKKEEPPTPPPEPVPPAPPKPDRLSTCCTPFSPDEGKAVHDRMRKGIGPGGTTLVPFPSLMFAASLCGEVLPVWEAYLDGTMQRFAFDEAAGSCVAKSAKNDGGGRGSGAAADHQEAVDRVLDQVIAFLPESLLKTVPPIPGFPPSQLSGPVGDLLGPAGEPVVHVDITYGNAPLNPAGQLAGGVGRDGNGSDVFGDDDRIMGGHATVEVTKFDPASGAMDGVVRWIPHVHVVDTVDFCPGNMGGLAAQSVTIDLSRLEKSGLAKDVPITIDYDLALKSRSFSGIVPHKLASPPVPPPRRKRGPGPDAHVCR